MHSVNAYAMMMLIMIDNDDSSRFLGIRVNLKNKQTEKTSLQAVLSKIHTY